MDDRTVDLIFTGSLKLLPPVSSKIVRIFTSSTFTDEGVKPHEPVTTPAIAPFRSEHSIATMLLSGRNKHNDSTFPDEQKLT
ncbi:jg8752 [Pararge aegeria aegeria]|uniref:Jg8752 protein n=1 Tax=Pararge aegeria aegeria TaxID=348720 RepID=A0A8S4S2E7_9NEOP|nr:jg8752 [Pararge aegeria aegeria]